MKKYCNIYKFVIIFLVVLIILTCGSYKIGTSSVSKDSFEVKITIPKESTYLSISNLLKENNLIRSESFYKIYIKIFKPDNLKAGIYTLNRNMNVKEIVDTLEGNVKSEEITITIPEGKHIEEVAEIISSKINMSKEDILLYWQNEEVLNSLIDKYWFLTDVIKKEGIRYSLEGYFFPDTYSILKESKIEDITYKMLDKMDEVLSKYKEEISNSKFNVHEILTLASIVEHEAILDSDRPMIAGVFINRLDKSMKLQSCATVGYAINEWKLSYNYKDLQTDSPYNTYFYEGLPIGPGNMPGELSIEAVLRPTKHDYYYFLANVNDKDSKKTYYSKTYSEHRQKCVKYLGRSC
ncbi:MAG: endolytic transglycosylase MltG [Acholeplasma sp.]|nr:endolytic transglycosylase MltG [Acholeplasma sp.]CCY28334.1 yceG family protein [Acholeplasma sp. CAG:878]